jgi:hypothetical protein
LLQAGAQLAQGAFLLLAPERGAPRINLPAEPLFIGVEPALDRARLFALLALAKQDRELPVDLCGIGVAAGLQHRREQADGASDGFALILRLSPRLRRRRGHQQARGERTNGRQPSGGRASRGLVHFQSPVSRRA